MLPAFRFTVPTSVVEGLGMNGFVLSEVSPEVSEVAVEVSSDERVERVQMSILAFVYFGGVAVMLVVLDVRGRASGT